jgi:hypothetical protein
MAAPTILLLWQIVPANIGVRTPMTWQVTPNRLNVWAVTEKKPGDSFLVESPGAERERIE